MTASRRSFLTAAAAFAAGASASTGEAEAATKRATSILNGKGTPAPNRGTVGDFYIDDLTHAIYGPKRGTGWGRPTSLIGPAGSAAPVGPTDSTGSAVPAGVAASTAPQGYLMLNGDGPPPASLGVDNDFYIDTASTQLYGPKEGGVWGSPISLTGRAISAADLPSSVVSAEGALSGQVPVANGSNGYAWGAQSGGGPSALTPTGITGQNSYDSECSYYNRGAVNQKKLRGALGRALGGVGFFNILCGGDSYTWGTGASASSGSYPMQLRYQLAQALPSVLGPTVAGTGLVQPYADDPASMLDSRYVFYQSGGTVQADSAIGINTLAGHWNANGYYNVGVYSETNGDYLIFTSDLPGTAVTIVVWNGGSNAITFSIDGDTTNVGVVVGAGGSTTNKSGKFTASSYGWTTLTVTGLANTSHTVKVTNTTASGSQGGQIAGIDVYQSSGVKVSNLGLPGIASAGWAASGLTAPLGFLNNTPAQIGTTTQALNAGTDYETFSVNMTTGVSGNASLALVNGNQVQYLYYGGGSLSATGAGTYNAGQPFSPNFTFPSGTAIYQNNPNPYLAPDLSFICLGLNDHYSIVSGTSTVAQFQATMLQVVTQLLMIGSSVVLVVPPAPMSVDDNGWNGVTVAAGAKDALWLSMRQALYTVADNTNVALIDLTDRLGTFGDQTLEGLINVSLTHPNNAGYGAISRAIADFLL